MTLEAKVKQPSMIRRLVRSVVIGSLIGLGINNAYRYVQYHNLDPLQEDASKYERFLVVNGQQVKLDYISKERYDLEIKILNEIDTNGDSFLSHEEFEAYKSTHDMPNQ